MTEILPPTVTPPPTGRQQLIALAVFMVLFILLCWGLNLMDGGSSSPASAAQATASPTPTVEDTPTESPVADNASIPGEDPNGAIIYPLSVRTAGSQGQDAFPSMTDAELNAEGRDICSQLDAGDTPGDVAVRLLITYTPQQAGALLGAAPVAFCPAYSDDVDTFMHSLN